MSKLSRWPLAIPLITFVLLPPLTAVPAWCIDYEIPLSDLKKVEKKPRKPTRKGHREKKKEDAGQGASPTDSGTAAPPAPAASPSHDAGTTAPPAPQTLQRDATAETVRVVHEPNSYVVTGKRTVIMAFVSSQEPLQSVHCQFRSTEGGGYAVVPMTKEEGRYYTYSATLPALGQGGRTLRYRFVVIDTQGRETRSQEFVMPVKQTPVVPGWQQDPSRELIKVDLVNPDESLEGFVDVMVRGSRRQ